MNVLILGATGRVGKRVVALALGAGHSVTVLARSPEKLVEVSERLTVIQGNVLNRNDIERSMRGIDAVVSALNTDGGTVLTDSIPLIIEAMRKESVKRIVTIGTAGILQSRTDSGVLRYLSSESKRKSTRSAEEHRNVYEKLLASELEWTIICPTYLRDGEEPAPFRVERDYLPLDGHVVSVAATAEFAFQQIDNKAFNRSRVGIAY